MESMSDGEKKAVIITRLLSVAVIISVFAFATAIKKPFRGDISNNDNILEIAFLEDLVKPADDEIVAKEDSIEVPVTATPEEDVEKSDEEKVDEDDEELGDVEEKSEESVNSNPNFTSASYPARAAVSNSNSTSTYSSASSSVKAPNPNYPSNYDAGSPYAGQVYVDGGEAPKLNNPTYYEIPGGNPNVVVEPEESEESAPILLEDSETEE